MQDGSYWTINVVDKLEPLIFTVSNVKAAASHVSVTAMQLGCNSCAHGAKFATTSLPMLNEVWTVVAFKLKAEIPVGAVNITHMSG